MVADHRPLRALLEALACTAVMLALAVSPALAAADPAVGARLFLLCRACHAVARGAPAGVGPTLFGVLGAPAGQRPGYTYSPALAASGLTWTRENLDRWLTEPTALVPGTKMAFAGVASPAARQNLIAYLATLHPAQ